jgi:hypothetical protein
MTSPCISIDRQTKAWAVFDDHKLVKNFENYQVEAEALSAAKVWIAERTGVQPTVVYPKVTRMGISLGRRYR